MFVEWIEDYASPSFWGGIDVPAHLFDCFMIPKVPNQMRQLPFGL
jgi:hypothetical protein